MGFRTHKLIEKGLFGFVTCGLGCKSLALMLMHASCSWKAGSPLKGFINASTSGGLGFESQQRRIKQIYREKHTRDLRYGARCTVRYGSHRTAQDDAVRCESS
ncbi:unnamed protein product [Brassica rapa subsp. narinosa]|uniref:(rape) hypothetical protein n=1 Tax=Brassica napus TaxID=3708 RepID=A0A817B5N6_BRANA|nr:unnamed protein product [Brassica napus]